MDRTVVVIKRKGFANDRAADKYNRPSQVDFLIDRLTELCGALVGTDSLQNAASNIPGRPAPSHIADLCTRFSECDLALFVHAQCKMNPAEIDRLFSMDMAAIDNWIAVECPPARRTRIKPLHMVSVSLNQLRERVLAELRLSLHEIDSLTKPQMIGYLCTVRPGLLKDWFIQGAVTPDQSSSYD